MKENNTAHFEAAEGIQEGGTHLPELEFAQVTPVVTSTLTKKRLLNL